MPGNHFIIHAADARMGDTVARSTEIIGYDEKKRRFLARAYFDRNGDRLTGLWEMKSGKARWQPWIDLQLVRA